MLCPCCGKEIAVESRECGCGARFVGAPLDEKPVTVTIKSYGPVMNAIGLLAVVTMAALIFTKFFALGAILVVWYTARVMKRVRRQPEEYGGYKLAAATLIVTLVAGVAALALTAANIPAMLKRRQLKKEAATVAAFNQFRFQLEQYNRAHGTYPINAQEFAKATNQQLPLDSWQHQIKYTSSTEVLLAASSLPQSTRIPMNNFELRSNGPDEIANTDDDIVMVDGILYTGAEYKKQTASKTSFKK